MTLRCWSLVVLHPPADLHYLSGRRDNFSVICREKWILGKSLLPILFEKQFPHHTVYMMYMHRYLFCLKNTQYPHKSAPRNDFSNLHVNRLCLSMGMAPNPKGCHMKPNSDMVQHVCPQKQRCFATLPEMLVGIHTQTLVAALPSTLLQVPCTAGSKGKSFAIDMQQHWVWNGKRLEREGPAKGSIWVPQTTWLTTGEDKFK